MHLKQAENGIKPAQGSMAMSGQHEMQRCKQIGYNRQLAIMTNDGINRNGAQQE